MPTTQTRECEIREENLQAITSTHGFYLHGLNRQIPPPNKSWTPLCSDSCLYAYRVYMVCTFEDKDSRRGHKSIFHDPGVEERPNGITVHSLPPTGRRGSFNSNTTTCDLLYQKVVAVHGLLGLSRLSNRKGVKTILPFETNTKSLEESPASPSTTGCRSPQERPSIHSQRSEQSASSIRTRFPFIGSVMSHSRATSEQSGLNGGKASDWLRPESVA